MKHPNKKTTEQDHIVGKRVKALRKSRKMSQTAFGDAIGLSFQQIQKYENGANRIAAGRLQAIADFFGVPVSTFFVEDDDAVEQTAALEFLNTPGAVDLLRTFIEIDDEQLRREVLALVVSIARIGQKMTFEA